MRGCKKSAQRFSKPFKKNGPLCVAGSTCAMQPLPPNAEQGGVFVVGQSLIMMWFQVTRCRCNERRSTSKGHSLIQICHHNVHSKSEPCQSRKCTHTGCEYRMAFIVSVEPAWCSCKDVCAPETPLPISNTLPIQQCDREVAT